MVCGASCLILGVSLPRRIYGEIVQVCIMDIRGLGFGSNLPTKIEGVQLNQYILP